MKYINEITESIGHTYEVTRSAPFDARLVQSSINDLYSSSAFVVDDLGDDYRYEGMLVTVVGDQDSTNDGVYILDKWSERNNSKGWTKLIGLPTRSQGDTEDDYVLEYDSTTGKFNWVNKKIPQNLGDLSDVSINNPDGDDVLTWDYTENKWVAKPASSGGSVVTFTASMSAGTKIGTITIDGQSTDIYAPAGGGGSAVTTASINYNKLFDDTASGGLNLQERHDMGFLERSSFSHNGQSGVIPPNTSYESIFRKMFCGVTASVTGNLNYSTTWDGTSKSYNNNVSPVANPTGAVLKYSIGTNSSAGSNWMNYSGSSITATNVSETPKYIWFKSVYTDGTDTAESSVAKGTFTISKRPSTITPTTSKNTYTIGETLVLGTPTISNIASNVSPTASDIQNEVTYNIQNNSTLNTVGNINITVSNISYLNSTYPNYNFSSGSNTITVYPVIQYKTLLDSDWCNYLTSYSTYNSGTYSSSLSTYQVSKNSPANSYMLPLISQKVPTSNNFKLRIKKPYHLANTKYDFDTPNNNWKAVAATAFTEFNLISSSGDYNEYQYIGNDVATPLAITIEK